MTPAISDGSRPLSAACWRMMSSWRSGSAISCTALSANGRTIAIASAARPRARRPARPAGAAGCSAGAPWCAGRGRLAAPDVASGGPGGSLRAHALSLPSTSDKRASSSSIVPEFATAKVARARLLVLGELARGALVDGLVAAGGGALAPHLLVGDDRDRGVEAGSMPASNSSGTSTTSAGGDGSRRGLAPRARLSDPLADARPEQALEEAALLRVRERASRRRRARSTVRRAPPPRPSAPTTASRTSGSA